jgi:lipopolysaccharide/colanic/teichoic acid biosynthesis glycosyltransferase
MRTVNLNDRSILGRLTNGGSYPDYPPVKSGGLQAESSTYLGHKLHDSEGITSATRKRESSCEIPRWKRVLDLACILASLPLWLPVMIFIALWIKVVSPGPVLFRQERVGLKGRRFTILKFRSMKANAETSSHNHHLQQLIASGAPMQKLDALGDPRVIPGGKWLRSLGLDELAQIFNVIRGEMSLVGPRPCTVAEFERYADSQTGRFNVAPGLTGYWQVSGKNKTTFQQMIELDCYYAEHLSLPLDLAILAATIPAMVLQCVESRSAARSFSSPHNRADLASSDELAKPVVNGVH